MQLKALDSFYTDETKMVSDGQVFDVESDELGKDLIKRGVARAAAADDNSQKAVTAPKNKDAGASPANRSAK